MTVQETKMPGQLPPCLIVKESKETVQAHEMKIEGERKRGVCSYHFPHTINTVDLGDEKGCSADGMLSGAAAAISHTLLTIFF